MTAEPFEPGELTPDDLDGLELEVFGVRLNTVDIGLNTALVAGSDQVALAAKVHGVWEPPGLKMKEPRPGP